jgi:hypothetical protein
MSKWIKLERGVFGLSASATMFDKIVFYAGRSDSWGISIEVSFYERSLTFKILNLYAGLEVLHSDKWLDPDYKSKGDLFD